MRTVLTKEWPSHGFEKRKRAAIEKLEKAVTDDEQSAAMREAKQLLSEMEEFALGKMAGEGIVDFHKRRLA